MEIILRVHGYRFLINLKKSNDLFYIFREIRVNYDFLDIFYLNILSILYISYIIIIIKHKDDKDTHTNSPNHYPNLICNSDKALLIIPKILLINNSKIAKKHTLLHNNIPQVTHRNPA